MRAKCGVRYTAWGRTEYTLTRSPNTRISLKLERKNRRSAGGGESAFTGHVPAWVPVGKSCQLRDIVSPHRIEVLGNTAHAQFQRHLYDVWSRGREANPTATCQCQILYQ
jgi:hypothetical protein